MSFPIIASTSGPTTITSDSSNWTIVLPTGVQSGDLLIAMLGVDGAAGVSGSSFPAGWEKEAGIGSIATVLIGSRIADGSEGSSFDMTLASAQQGVYVCYRITGAHAENTVLASSNALTSQSSTYNPPARASWNNEVGNHMWIAMMVTDGTPNWVSNPTNYNLSSLHATSGGSAGAGLAVCARQLNANTDDPDVFTLDAATYRSGATLVVREGTGAYTITPNVLDTVPSLKIPTVVLSQQNLSIGIISTEGVLHEPGMLLVFSVSAISVSTTMLAATVSNIGNQQNLVVPALNITADLQSPFVGNQITVNSSVIDGNDDGVELSTDVPNLTPVSLECIQSGTVAGIRFRNLQVPNNARIVNARVTIVLANTSKNDAEGTWHAEVTDNAQGFTTDDGDIANRIRTTSFASWTTNDLGNAGISVQSPSLVSVIEEIIDRPGWVAGNSIAMLYAHNSGTDTLSMAAFEHTTYDPPKLTIDFVDTVVVLAAPVFSATATMLGPSVGNVVIAPEFSTTTTLIAPNTILFEQLVAPIPISTNEVLIAPTVALGLMLGIGVKVFFNELSKAAITERVDYTEILTDRNTEATVVESDYTVEFGE